MSANSILSSSAISRRELLTALLQSTVSLALLGSVPSRAAKDGEVFNFIVVGSGAGGGPLAANLAAAGFKVLLIEAGDDCQTPNSSVPGLHAMSTEDPLYAWNFYVRHYSGPSSLAAKADPIRGESSDSKWVPNRGILYPRAGTLGGCTAHNAMITMCADRRDWDGIAEVTGDASWKSAEMRRHYEAVRRWLHLEQNRIELLLGDRELLKIVRSAAIAAGGFPAAALEKSLSALAHGEAVNLTGLDPNDPAADAKEGLFLTPNAISGGVRIGARDRVNAVRTRFPDRLVVSKHTLATRIVLEGPQNRAVAVEFLRGPHLYAADPNRRSCASASRGTARLAPGGEVIVAGGAFNTPQLLMLSGIGPRDQLDRFWIKTAAHLPGVGQNLQDRYEVSVVTKLKRPLKILEHGPSARSLAHYQADRAASVYSTNGIVVGIKKRSSPDREEPDLFVFGVPGYFKGYYPGWSRDFFRNDVFTWAILKGHTENTRGEVRLKSADPTEVPDINFKFFDDGRERGGADLDAVLDGVKFARSITQRRHARSLLERELLPGESCRGDDEVREYIRREAWGHHASCSNKMGAASDPMSVVDSEFNVHHTRGLRVVDASVFPRIPGLFISLPIYMIAEKASEVILRDAWRRRCRPA